MIGQLEDAVVARIKAAQTAALWPYKIATIDSYSGQISEDEQSTFKFPAVFVAFAGWKIRKIGERSRVIDVSLIVYAAARNPRNERATRQGDSHEPGSFQIAEDIIALLENQRVGLAMNEALSHTAIQTISIGREKDPQAESILAIPFECSFGWKAALPECANVAVNDWLKTGQTYYIKPGDDIADLSAVNTHALP
jgi:phage gp37-like protein